MNIIFGVMVALAAVCFFYAHIGYREKLGVGAPFFLWIATICTGVAAGMVY